MDLGPLSCFLSTPFSLLRRGPMPAFQTGCAKEVRNLALCAGQRGSWLCRIYRHSAGRYELAPFCLPSSSQVAPAQHIRQPSPSYDKAAESAYQTMSSIYHEFAGEIKGLG